MCVCVCVCVCVCHHLYGWGYFCVHWYGFMGILFFVLRWIFQHVYLDTYCFECLICMRFVFLYLHLFSAMEHVSHGKAL